MDDKRIFGEEVRIRPKLENSKMIYVTMENYTHDTTFYTNPSFWLGYKGELYYGICQYNMKFAETFDDWDIDGDTYFNQFRPGEFEFTKLNGWEPNFYKVDFDIIHKDEGRVSEWEMRFIIAYERSGKIDDLLE